MLIAGVGVAMLVLVPLIWGLLRKEQGLPMFGAPTVAELEDPSYRPHAREATRDDSRLTALLCTSSTTRFGTTPGVPGPRWPPFSTGSPAVSPRPSCGSARTPADPVDGCRTVADSTTRSVARPRADAAGLTSPTGSAVGCRS